MPIIKNGIISPFLPAGKYGGTKQKKILWTNISESPQVQADIVTSVKPIASIKTVTLITAVLSRLLAMLMGKNLRT